jgi:hypothetical protein
MDALIIRESGFLSRNSMGNSKGIPTNTECNLICLNEMQLPQFQEEVYSFLRSLSMGRDGE